MIRSAAVLLVLAALLVAAPSAQTTVAAAASTPEKNAKVVRQCHAAFDPYIAMLHKIKATLSGTPKFKAYDAAVNKMVDKYSNNINSIKLPSTSCTKYVLGPLTGAYIKYYSVDRDWDQCRERQRCGAAMADFKKRWKLASKSLKSAEKGFGSVSTR